MICQEAEQRANDSGHCNSRLPGRSRWQGKDVVDDSRYCGHLPLADIRDVFMVEECHRGCKVRWTAMMLWFVMDSMALSSFVHAITNLHTRRFVATRCSWWQRSRRSHTMPIAAAIVDIATWKDKETSCLSVCNVILLAEAKWTSYDGNGSGSCIRSDDAPQWQRPRRSHFGSWLHTQRNSGGGWGGGAVGRYLSLVVPFVSVGFGVHGDYRVHRVHCSSSRHQERKSTPREKK